MKFISKTFRVAARNTLTFFEAWSYANIIRRSKIVDYLRHNRWKRKVYLRDDDIIVLPKVDIYLVNGCNLRCENCLTFSPFRDTVISKNILFESMDLWSKKIEPEIVFLLGGEPLLHPDFQEITKHARSSWPNSRIGIITNGLVLHQVDDDFLHWMSEHRVEFSISRHVNTKGYNNLLKNAISRFDRHCVPYEIIESHKSWVTCYKIDRENVPVPTDSNPAQTWRQCLTKYCTALIGPNIFRCSPLANIYTALQEKRLSPEWDMVLRHQPVSFDDSPQKILNYLLGTVMKECSVCPDSFVNIVARQMSNSQVADVKQCIQNRILESNSPDFPPTPPVEV